jgi:beta-aspartyl-peptidase (threonine type)
MTAQGIAQESDPPVTWALAIHGGAGSSPDMFSAEANQQRYNSMRQALETGSTILAEGGTSLDAVEAVVRLLEDDPQFNAGRGAVFNADSRHELDASIMDGSNLACGAVAGVTTIRNPVSLARLVMTETGHVLLSGSGAEAFAATMQVERVENSWFDTPATLQRWKEIRKEQEDGNSQLNRRELRRKLQIVDMDTGSYLGTVGCVAVDRQGNLAAATSTGGLTNKRFGRIGDSPIIAAGTYASNDSCAVSCTGIGEEFIRHVVAYDVAARMKYKGTPVDQAVREILASKLPEAAGGIIAVDHRGNVTMQFSTAGMARAAADSRGRFDVFWHQQESGSQPAKQP